MLENIQNLGNELSKNQQKKVKGGFGTIPCRSNRDCWDAYAFLGPGDVSCRENILGFGFERVCTFN
ncbi:hypothetical protein [Tenacibaculum agarivorans]|uniref:hypothetical protein n=1 Tax=Tenacibaculum agarivorans TaxID=1908389 RepID=UPI00094B9CBF|nr:hypothetical protein [Tenacibaculum agarivorans]